MALVYEIAKREGQYIDWLMEVSSAIAIKCKLKCASICR